MTTHTREADRILVVDAYAQPAAEPDARALNEANRSIDYVCSTEAVDSHGTILKQNWILDRYTKNPVVLFAHNSRSIPVGTASMVRVENGRLVARVTFAPREVSEDADDCWRAVQAGLLRGISVGFRSRSHRWEMVNDVEVLVLDQNELLELSVCAVPSNADTLAQREALTTLRAQAQRQRPAQGLPPMNEDELKALRDAAAKHETLATARAADLAVAQRDLAAARADIEKRDADLAALRATNATMTAEAERLNGRLADQTARADKAEDALARLELETHFGRDVEPAEAEHFLALRKASPALYEAEMKRRAAAGRNDRLTDKTIPADAPAQREAATADPGAAFQARLAALTPATHSQEA